MDTERAGQPHLLTIALEDYFQVGAFNQLIQRGQWYRFEPRLERSTARTLDLLDEFGVRATFFVLGWIADTVPEVVRMVADRGHEIASKGYYHRGIRQMTPEEFREDLWRSREALRRATGQRILGYRVADQWFTPGDLWALDVLAAEGYEYDSSVGTLMRRFSAEPWRRFKHAHHFGDRTLWEFPIATTDVLGWLVPIAGGNYIRQFPQWVMHRAIERWHRTYAAPFVMYFHTWELDPDQPRINAAPWLQRIRQYRNLDRMPDILRYYLGRYRFTGIADHLGLSVTERRDPSRHTPAPAFSTPVILPPEPANPTEISERPRVSIVIPCYNEELILPYLANTLDVVEAELGRAYRLEFIFVDDASKDGTWAALQTLFGFRINCKLVRHERNKGVAGGIMTGLAQAETEIVCSIDCDCTYDPHELGRMIPLLTPGVDLVTASPYHPRGTVRNVPEWRLTLSRTLSALYRRVLRQKLYTYTSCFRVYRRGALVGVPLRETGFLGVAEMLGILDLRGARIVEYPATLEVRMLGRSKMKIVHTILGHLRLLGRFAFMRLTRRIPPNVPPAPISTPESAPRESIRH